MRTIFTFLFLTIFSKSFGQFAKIVDKQGYANVRYETSSNSKIVGKIKSDEIVYIFNKGDDNGKWLIVDYEETNGNLLTGYVHNSRLKNITDYENIPSAITDENGVNFILRDIDVNIKTELFSYKANKKYFSGQNINQKYKGQETRGTDGAIPKSNYKSIKITIGSQTIFLAQKEFENLFDVNNDNTYCYYDNGTETLYITSMNSDGAGSYEVLFIIEKGKYKGRRIYNAD